MDIKKCTGNRRGMNRREFIRKSGYIALGATVAPWLVNTACSGRTAQVEAAAAQAEEATEPTVYIAKNAQPADLTRKAVDALGGMGRFVSEGDKVALSPNIGWSRTPEQAATTHPDVVKAIVEMCFEAGAKQVEIFCNPCASPKVTYEMSGIAEAAYAAGAYVLYLGGQEDYQEVNFPDAVWSKTNKVAKALLNADVYINAPIAKHHGLCRLTLIQKNLMGAIWNRGQLHQNIHRELVALQKVLPADLYVIDCTRILLRNGPTGGSLKDVLKLDQVVAGVDPIAMESYAATLFNIDPSSIGFIKLGQDEGLGTMDWQSCSEIIH